MFAETVSYSAAFAAGLLSFFSPCVLPLIPAYFSFITGMSIEDLTENFDAAVRRKVFISTLSFILGFSSVFILLGASASFLGGLTHAYRDVIRIAGGIIIIVLGVHLTGLVRIPVLEFEKRIHLKSKPLNIFGTFLVGMAFGAGWSPCTGPQLGSILAIAMGKDTIRQGVVLLGIYSAGLALPFMIISIFVNYLLVFVKKATRFMKVFNVVAGSVLILVGCLLLANKLYLLTGTG
ncbi:MAG: cytochrome c biogenesis protein CcdA [Deltaproteobacteria bacterium]|nr:cytochrome c biogenesis protein CcdA [Deltaproteobacteria bacterium]MBW2612276.1 cytochrome c biogenesis protein CcdA [Deltaproteobacteria bacterium]